MIVKKGLAISYRRYSKKFIEDVIQAKSNNLGIWNGSFLEVLQPIKHQILMDDFINKNKSKFNYENLKFSSKLKK